MKKIGLIILFVLLAFSCKNSIDNKISKKGYGVISFTSSARTVQENFNVETLTDICLFGKNIEEESDFVSLKSWDVYDNFISDSLSIAVGSYKFYITAKIGNVGFESDVVSVDIEESSRNIINFKVYVTDRGTGKGTVNLKFTFGGFPVTQGSFELNKITYESNGRNSQKINDIEQSALFVTPYDGVNKTDAFATFKADLNPGVYELISRFENPDLRVAVYPVTIHISEGQTSSDEIEVLNFNPFYDITYYDGENPIADLNSTYYPTKYSIYDEITFRPLDAKDTYNPFQGWYTEDNVKIEKISKYERTDDLRLSAKWHLDSQYMLFSKVEPSPNSERYTSFEMTSDLSSSVESSISVAEKVIDFTIGGGDFLYYLTEAETKTIKKYNDPYFNLPCDYTYTSGTGNINDIIELLYYDYKTDKTYGISDSMNSMCIIENENLTSYSIDWNGYYIDLTLLDFAIDEDKLYIVCLYDGLQTSDRRYEVNYFTKQDNTYLFQKTINIDTASIPNDYFQINDMICMEGKVYILWNYMNYATSFGIYNYGGILCYDETEDECSQLLLYSTPENLPIITTTKPVNTDGTGGGTKDIQYQGPSSTNYTSHLFGPKKFVAIKPKKLVIADEGLFVYADSDSNATAKAENVNRVVTIDLDNLSTPFVSQNVSVLFNENYPENTTVTFCCNYELKIKESSMIKSTN